MKEKVEALKEVINKNNSEDIKAKTEELQKSMYEVSTKLYQQAAPQGEQNAQAGQNVDGNNVYDADYKDVDDNNK